jgi:Mo-dependent nitrogenase C-terminus
MNVFDYTTKRIFFASWISVPHEEDVRETNSSPLRPPTPKRHGDILQPLRQWVDNVKVSDRHLAHRLCKSIPSQCPFERDVKFFGKKLFHIPPMCKLNPLYDEVVGLRFRAMCYLADECGEDISQYC